MQSEPSLVELEVTSSCPAPCYQQENTAPRPSASSRHLSRAIRSPLDLLFSRVNNSSSLLIRLVLQTLPQLCSCSCASNRFTAFFPHHAGLGGELQCEQF